jgi:hypothetical protein
MHLYRSTRNDSPLSRHFLTVIMMVHLSVIRILRLNRRFSASAGAAASLAGFSSGWTPACMLPTMPRRQLRVPLRLM